MRLRVIASFSALLVMSVSLLQWPSPSFARQNAQNSQTPPRQPAQQPANAPRGSVQSPIQRIEVNLVNVFFSVFDQQNRIISDLDKKNFRVFDGKAEQEIRFFSRQTGLPLRVGLLMDTSNSI